MAPGACEWYCRSRSQHAVPLTPSPNESAPMIAGRRYWILIWYGFLLVGVVGAIASAYWGRQTRGRNLDEILRALGTILLSIGMLFLLYGVAALAGRILIGVALLLFIGAFWVGRKSDRPPPGPGRTGAH